MPFDKKVYTIEAAVCAVFAKIVPRLGFAEAPPIDNIILHPCYCSPCKYAIVPVTVLPSFAKI